MSQAWAMNAGKASTAIGTATIESDDNLLTITDHGLGDGDTVTVDTLTGGGSALTADAVYFVRDATTDDFALSLTLFGPQVEFASDGGADVYSFSPQYSAAQLRRLNAGLMFGGTSDAFGVRQGVRPGHVPLSVSGTTWTVEDLTGAVYPGLSSDDGGYPVAHQSESGSLDPADGSNDRIDALDLQIQDDDTDASGFRRARVVYVDGTPAADPDAPTVTSNALRLGTILVPSGGSPSPSIATLAQFTVASGGTLPVTGASQLPTAGRYAGMAAYRQDVQAPVWWDDDESEWRTGWPATVQDVEPASFEFTNTSYGTSNSSGTHNDCGTSFVAPITGRVMIYTNGTIDMVGDSGGGAVAYMAPVVREGGTVGSGSVVLSADNDRTVRAGGSGDTPASKGRKGVSHLLSGLTPGDTYNVRLEHRVTSGTGELLERSVQVAPAT